MEVPVTLAFPGELEIIEIETIGDVITLTAHSTRTCPCCPLCGTPAQRLHSRYIRRSHLVEIASVCKFSYENAFVM
jgi:hypothetical protein